MSKSLSSTSLKLAVLLEQPPIFRKEVYRPETLPSGKWLGHGKVTSGNV
jgi:hypothetical protein